MITLLVFGFSYLGFIQYREAARTNRLYEAQYRQIAQLETDQLRINRQLGQLASLKDTIAKHQRQLGDLDASNREMTAGLALPMMLWRNYSAGVCLISGSYVFIDDKSGLPLRLPKGEQTDNRSLLLLGPEQYTTEGDGPLAEVVYEGTGFHVGQGYILTNRHLTVEPWNYDFLSQLFSTMVKARPRLWRLFAYFPAQRRVYRIEFKIAAQSDDIAVCKLNGTRLPAALPVLPLEQGAEDVKVGQAVLTMGYPTGVDRLVVALGEEEAKRLRDRYGENTNALLEHLAQNRLIKPLTAQGHVLQLQQKQIVYDGVSGEGGSGAPVFGPAGRVIGIHFGAFRIDKASNYAAPIGPSLPLLRKAGWKPKL